MSAMTAQKMCYSFAATNHKLAEIVNYAVSVDNMHNMLMPLGVKQVWAIVKIPCHGQLGIF